MISGCNKVKSVVAKHPFIAISAVTVALSGVIVKQSKTNKKLSDEAEKYHL